jgi:hypothetical protein
MAINIPLITTFDAKGINRAISQFKKLEGSTAKSAFVVKNLDQGLNKAFKSLAMVGAGAALAGGAVAKVLLAEAYEAKKVTAETNAILKATGGAANISAAGIEALTNKLSLQIGVDDELIQKSANLLLTFKQVQNVAGAGNDVFSRAVTLAQDLGQVFGSTDSAAMQLGKALSDPIAGITALRRAGINFSAAQKENIKNLVEEGNLLQAQKVILDEVATQVGGTAAATATGFDRMKVALENVAETLGNLLLPYFEDLANWVANTVVPVVDDFAAAVGEGGLGGGLSFLGGLTLDFITNLEGMGAKIYWVTAAMVALKVATTAYAVASGVATVAAGAFSVAFNSTGFGLIVTAIAAVVVAVVAMALKFQWLRDMLKDIWNAIVIGIQDGINIILQLFEDLVNMFIMVVNGLIKAWNYVPFHDKVEPIKDVNFQISLMGALIEDATDKTKKLAYGIGGMGQVWIAMGKSLPTVNNFARSIGGAGSAVKTAEEKLQEYIKALKSWDSQTQDIIKAQKAVVQAQKDQRQATIDAADALEHFNNVANGYAADSQEAIAATNNLAQAQRRLEESNLSVADAQDAVVEAQKRLDALRQPASLRDVQSATDTLTEAQFGLADAQAALEKIQRRQNPNQRALIEAQIDVRNATYAVADAEAELQDIQDGASPEELAQAQKELSDAQRSLTDQLRDQEEATKEVNTAQSELNTVLNGAASDTDVYREALKLLNDAKDNEIAKSEAVTAAIRAERDAKYELLDAELALAAAQKKAPLNADMAAFEKTGIMSPALKNAFDKIDFAGLGRMISGRASGGSVMSNTPYIVGERGQELFVPSSNGTIIPNNELGGQTNIIVNVSGSVTTERQLVEQIRIGLLKAQKSGRAMVL